MLGSRSHGLAFDTALRNNSQSLMLPEIGPALAGSPTLFAPSLAPFSCPIYGTRWALGFTPYKPPHIAGILILPPTSVPTPKTLPLMATRAPSPPELPPAVTLLFL